MKASQLRASILQQAVEGKLVPQRPEEGTAKALLASIRAERESLLKAGKIKKAKPLPEITEDEIPFDIPETWEWVRLGNISSLITKGTTPRGGDVVYEKTGIGFLRAENIGGFDKLNLLNCNFVSENTHNGILNRSILKENDILITIAGTLGRTAMVRKEDLPLNTNQAISIIRLVNPEKVNILYLIYALNSPVIQSGLLQQKRVTAIPNLNLEIIAHYFLPLPPLAEQERIVTKLEELMPLIDAYEKEEAKLSALEKSLPEKLRRSVLQQAVEGKLVPQIPEEGTAAELLKEIEKERAELVKAGKMKKAKPLPEISEEEIPFEIPETWEWVRLGDVSDFGVNISAEAKDIKDSDWILELEDIEKDSGRLVGRKTKSERSSVSTKHKFSVGNVLYSKLRPYLNKVLVADSDGYCTSEIHVINFGKFIDSYYAKLFLQSPTFVNYADECSYGMKMPRLGTDDGKRALFPLPPLAEQKRIVAKVEELMQIIERL